MQFVPRQQEVPIGGVRVKFPFKPYPSQKAMMAKARMHIQSEVWHDTVLSRLHQIIQALNHGNNALLESPTGSGKSLALLCSVLAWQTQQYGEATLQIVPQSHAQLFTADKVGDGCVCPCHVKKEEPTLDSDPVPTPRQDGLKTESGSTSCQNETETTSTSVVPPTVPAGNADPLCKRESGAEAECGGGNEVKGETNPADEDFRKPKKRYRTPGGAVSVRSKYTS